MPLTIIPIDQLDPLVAEKGNTDLDEFVGPIGMDGAVPTIDALGVITWDDTFLKAGDDLDLLKGPSGQDSFIPILNGVGDISFTDQYLAPGDQVTELSSTPSEAGKFISVDGGGSLIFQSIAAASTLGVSVGASGDFATFAEAVDEIATNTQAKLGVIVVLEQVNWGTPTQTLDKPIAVQGVATDSEIVINTDDILTVDYGAADGFAAMDFNSLTITRQSAAAGGFDFTAHDAQILISNVTITDDTTNGAAQGIFDGDGENVEVTAKETTINGAGTTAKIFSRWASANISLDSSVSMPGFDLLNNVTAAEIFLDNYSLVFGSGLTSSTVNVRYMSNSLMTEEAGLVSPNGTINDVSGVASYNKVFDAISGMNWKVAIGGVWNSALVQTGGFVGSEFYIDEGTFDAVPNGVYPYDSMVVPQAAKITGAGSDLTILTSDQNTIAHSQWMLRLSGPGSRLKGLTIRNTETSGSFTDPLQLATGNITVEDVKLQNAHPTATNGTLLRVLGSNAKFFDCEIDFTAAPANLPIIIGAISSCTFERCKFLYSGSNLPATSLTWIDSSMTATSVLTVNNCLVDMGISTANGNEFIDAGSSGGTLIATDNVTKGNLRNFVKFSTINNSLIQGNSCDMSLGGIAATSAVEIVGGNFNVISDNKFLNCSGRGINVQVGATATTDWVIANNIIQGNAVDEGVRLSGAVTRSSIRGNQISGFLVGILTDPTGGQPDDNQYIGNHVKDNTTPITLDAGDTSEVSLNVEV
jgi:hypothetical protein